MREDSRKCGWRREGPAVKYLVCSPNKLRSYLTGGIPFFSQGQQGQIILLEDGWDVGGSRPTDQCVLVQFAFLLFQEGEIRALTEVERMEVTFWGHV